MKRSREQLKAELLAEAESAIEELIVWERQAGAPNLTAMEDKVLAVRQRLGQRLLEAAIEDQEARQPATPPQCPTCGAALRYKGQKEPAIESRLGGITVERGYYYCAHCESGLFPLSEQLQVVDERVSPGVARHAVWLAGLVPYDQAATILAQIGSLNVSASTIWRRVQAWGRQFAAQEQAERAQAQALPVKWAPPSRAEQADQRLGVALDGFMVHVVDEGLEGAEAGGGV